jgi:hypothetical protein
MKKCPFCAEEIQDEAIKCKHCGEFLNGSGPPRIPANNLPWYFRTWAIVLVIGSVGPLGLPMIWWHPRLSLVWKIVITAGTFVLTWLAYQSLVASIQTIKQYEDMLKTM